MSALLSILAQIPALTGHAFIDEPAALYSPMQRIESMNTPKGVVFYSPFSPVVWQETNGAQVITYTSRTAGETVTVSSY